MHSMSGSKDHITFSGTKESPYTEIMTNSSTASRTKISASDDRGSHELNDFTQGIDVRYEVAAKDNMV